MIIRSAFLIACTLPLISMSSVQVMAQRCPTIPGVHGPVSCCTNSEYVKLCRAMGIRWPTSRPAAQPQNPIPNDASAKNAQKAVKDEAEAEKKLAEAEKAEELAELKLKLSKKLKGLAEQGLDESNKKFAALQERIAATNDPKEKLGLLKQQLEVKQSQLPLVRTRDQMAESIGKDEVRLRDARLTTARAKTELAQATKARIAAVKKRSTLTGYTPTFETSQSTPSTAPSLTSGAGTNQQASTSTAPQSTYQGGTHSATSTTDPSSTASRATMSESDIARVTQPDPNRFYTDTTGINGSCVTYAKNVYSNMTGTEIGRVGTAANMIRVARQEGIPHLPGNTDPRSIPYPSLVVWSGTSTNRAGHVAVVTRVQGNQITVKEANFGPNMKQDGTFRTDNYGKVTTSTMSIDEFQSRSGARILGYITE